MYLLVLLAFAFVLWLPDDLPVPTVVHEPVAVLLLVAVQQVVMVGLGLVVSGLTIRKLNKVPNNPQQAQHVFVRWGMIVRGVLIASFIGLCLLTDWTQLVRGCWRLRDVYGAADLVMLVPFLVGAIVLLIGLYPGDRAVRQVGMASRLPEGGQLRRVWSVWGYLVFYLRNQLLVVALPMAVIVILYDAIQLNRMWLYLSTGMIWLPEVLLGVAAGLVFVNCRPSCDGESLM